MVILLFVHSFICFIHSFNKYYRAPGSKRGLYWEQGRVPMKSGVMSSSLAGRWKRLQTVTAQCGKSHNE